MQLNQDALEKAEAGAFMHLILIVAAAPCMVVCASCSAHVPQIPITGITGEWGGQSIEVTDSAQVNSIIVNRFCAAAIFPSPQLDSTGHFDVRGAYFRSTNVFQVGDSVHMTGQVVANQLDIDLILLRLEGLGPPTHFVLTRNAPPDLSLILCTDSRGPPAVSHAPSR